MFHGTDTILINTHLLDVIRECFTPDDTLEVTAAVGDVTRWYTCSKGHEYGIGNCGQPVGRGRCPDCGEPIGAGRADYAFADGRNAQQVRGLLNLI